MAETCPKETGILQEMRRVVASVVQDEDQASAVVYALIVNFGGERLYMPNNDYEGRNREMLNLHNAGASVEQLAKRYRMCARTVYRIISLG